MTTSTTLPAVAWNQNTNAIAFLGTRRVAAGPLAAVSLAVKAEIDRNPAAPAPLVFDALTSHPIELDLRGTAEDVLARLQPAAAEAETESGGGSEAVRGPGRPKLGVVPREITLLPRQWDWLNGQPGGASVALRKLVDVARREGETAEKQRRAQEAAYRFMSEIGGNLPEFVEVSRALFAGDREKFESLLEAWPADVRDHLKCLAVEAVA